MSVQYVNAHDGEHLHKDTIWGLQWTSLDQVVSVSADGALKVHAADGKHVVSTPAQPLGLVSLSVSSSGSTSLSNSIDGTTTLHALTDGSVLATHESFRETKAGGSATWAVAMHPDDAIFASAGAGGSAYLRSAKVSEDGEESDEFGSVIQKLETGSDKILLEVKYSPDGRLVATAGESGRIYIFDVKTGALGATYPSHHVCVRTLSWSPDSQFLYSGSDDHSIQIHDVRTSSTSAGFGKASGSIATLSGHSSWVLSLDAAPDGRLLASSSADKSIKLWDLRAGGAGGSKGGCVSTQNEGSEIWAVSWRPGGLEGVVPGKDFVSGGEEQLVRYWRAAGSA